MLISILHPDTFAKFRRLADDSSHLKLVVDYLRRAKDDLVALGPTIVLTQWPYDFASRYHHRGRSSIISDRKIEAGRRQRSGARHRFRSVLKVLQRA